MLTIKIGLIQNLTLYLWDYSFSWKIGWTINCL